MLGGSQIVVYAFEEWNGCSPGRIYTGTLERRAATLQSGRDEKQWHIRSLSGVSAGTRDGRAVTLPVLQFDFLFAVAVGPPFFVGDELSEDLLDTQNLGVAEHVVRHGFHERGGGRFGGTELLGVEHDKVVVGKVFREERGDVVGIGVERHRGGACAHDDKEVVVEHDVGQQHEIVPALEHLELVANVVSAGSQPGLQVRNGFGVGIEDGPAAYLLGHVGHAVYPPGKTGFKLGLAGYGDDDAGNGIDGVHTLRDENHLVGVLEQRLDFGPEEGVDDVGLVVQTQYHFGNVPLLHGVDDAAGDVHVVPGDGNQFRVGRRGYFPGQFENRLRAVVACLAIVGYMQGIQGRLFPRRFEQESQVDKVLGGVGVGDGNENMLVLYRRFGCGRLVVLHVDDYLAGRFLGHQSTDDTGHQNHHDGTVEDFFVE